MAKEKKIKSVAKVQAGKKASLTNPWIQFLKVSPYGRKKLPKKGTPEYNQMMKDYASFKVNGAGIFGDILGAVGGAFLGPTGQQLGSLVGNVGDNMFDKRKSKKDFLGRGSLYPMWN
jgi:hypothetical protein